MGDYLRTGLENLLFSHPKKISNIKGKGLLIGISCKISNVLVCDKARKKGLLIVAASNNVVRLLPPLKVKKKEIDIALSILDKTLKEIT